MLAFAVCPAAGPPRSSSQYQRANTTMFVIQIPAPASSNSLASKSSLPSMIPTINPDCLMRIPDAHQRGQEQSGHTNGNLLFALMRRGLAMQIPISRATFDRRSDPLWLEYQPSGQQVLNADGDDHYKGYGPPVFALCRLAPGRSDLIRNLGPRRRGCRQLDPRRRSSDAARVLGASSVEVRGGRRPSSGRHQPDFLSQPGTRPLRSSRGVRQVRRVGTCQRGPVAELVGGANGLHRHFHWSDCQQLQRAVTAGEFCDELRRRCTEHLGGRRVLIEVAALAHHCNAIAESHRFIDVMG